ncbi:hypothetical protein C809_00318 [Lachnospiraceae bacterium MD335]|nr:hypothetical protein C809_00318 [Lachnospiraceae bacterium MD335]
MNRNMGCIEIPDCYEIEESEED